MAECLRRAAGALYRDSTKNAINGLIDAVLRGTKQGLYITPDKVLALMLNRDCYMAIFISYPIST